MENDRHRKKWNKTYKYRDGRDHWLSSDTQLILMAPRPFLSHTLITASAGVQNLVRGRHVFTYQF